MTRRPIEEILANPCAAVAYHWNPDVIRENADRLIAEMRAKEAGTFIEPVLDQTPEVRPAWWYKDWEARQGYLKVRLSEFAQRGGWLV